MKNKILILLLFLGIIFYAGCALAEVISIDVSNQNELSQAVDTINQAASGQYVINLKADVTTDTGFDFYSAAEKTILGNKHTLKYTGTDSLFDLFCGTLNLGDSTANEIIISGNNQTGRDSTSLIHVCPDSQYGRSSVMNMFEGVTIRDWNADNTMGAAVRVYSTEFRNDLKAEFNMYGGTITNCGIVSGSDNYGGGVGVSDNGIFNMYGGSIRECKNALQGDGFGGGVGLALQQSRNASSVNLPEFNMYGGEITKNTAHQGGGVYILDGTFNMKGGKITENRTGSMGGGIAVSGINYQCNGCINIENGSVTDNHSTSFGGGIVLFGAPLTMNNGIICNNISTQAGDDVCGIYADFSLSSAKAMNQKLKREDKTTRYTIDGWYWDYQGSGYTRWNYEQAFENENVTENDWMGDTITAQANEGYIFIKAAFTAYSEIEITKTWDDNNDASGKRPDSITVTLLDSATEQPVQKRSLTGGGDATVTLTPDASGDWKGTIDQLPLGVYSTGYSFSEVRVTNYDTTVSAITAKKADATTSDNEYGVYAANIDNVLTTHVNIYKIWDDANNKDGKRPTSLNTSLEQSGKVLKDINDADAIVALTEDETTKQWKGEVVLKGDDYSKLAAYEGDIADYTKVSTNITYNDDGSITVVFINKHTLEAAASDTIRNDNMVEIHYQAGKTWAGTNPVGDRQLPRPQITVILYADGVEYDRQVIAADTQDPATATFSNVPKYKDNDGNDPITYTIKEEITDSNWVKVGDNEWYSLDGMGKYTAAVTDVTATDVGNTQALGTLTGGGITNTYTANQTEITVEVTKQWKDHQNENGVRPGYLRVGLFKNESDTNPVKTVTLTGPANNDEWTGTFTGLPLYDENGDVIDYSLYTVKEAYPKTLNGEGQPTSWNDWLKPGESQTVTKDGAEYVYDYSIVTNP